MGAVRPQGHHQLTAPPRTVTVATTRLLRWIDGFADRHGSYTPTVMPTQVRLEAVDSAVAQIEVPFPPLEGHRVADLLAHVMRERTVGVLLVRRGGFAAGVFTGDRLETSKVDSTYVQGTTKAGGWSQQRYARRRANQAAHAFAEAAEVAVRVFDDTTLDALVAGGDREAVRAVLADRRLVHLEPLLTGPWLTVKDPKLKILAAMPEQFLTVRIQITDP